jgi:hypothetical protein
LCVAGAGFAASALGDLLAELPNKMRQPRGLNIVFPARFTPSHTGELHLVGGNLVDEGQLRPKCADEDEEEAYWDDQDAMEADYIVSSVADVGSMTQELSDIEQYPRLVVPDYGPVMGSSNNCTLLVHRLLDLLMPIADLVHKNKSHKPKWPRRLSPCEKSKCPSRKLRMWTSEKVGQVM